jgi:tetraacyldisaccharide 4'-kinase
MLPVGDLREKIRNLSRADIVVVNKSYGNFGEDDLKLLDNIFKGPVYECIFKPTVLVNTRFQKTDDASVLKGKKIYAFTAIANPEQFKNMLLEIGAEVVKLSAYPDHHYYSTSDFEQIRDAYQALECQYLVTTEKDLVKINPDIFKDLNLVGVGLGGELSESNSFLEKLNQYIDIKF